MGQVGRHLGVNAKLPDSGGPALGAPNVSARPGSGSAKNLALSSA